MTNIHCLHVPSHCRGKRLDLFICEAMPQLSRARVQSLIHGRHIVMHLGTTVYSQLRASHRLKGEEEITIRIPPAPPTELKPQNISLDFLHEDPWLVVLAKPAGLVVHPGAGQPQNTLVNALLYPCQTGQAPPLFYVVCNRPKEVEPSYERYLVRCLRQEFGFEGVPLKLFFRARESGKSTQSS